MARYSAACGQVRAMVESYRDGETKAMLHRPREQRRVEARRAEARRAGGAGAGAAAAGVEGGGVTVEPSSASAAAQEEMEEEEREEEEVAFTSTQALWSSVVRAAGLTSERAEAAGGADVPALRAWCERMRERESRLLPVANVYATPRLWANVEWAAFVLLDKDVFVPTDNGTGA